MELIFKTNVNTTKEAIWSLYENVDQWKLWDMELEESEIQGEFKNNTKGTMRVKGQYPLEFILFDIVHHQAFWNKAQTPMGIIKFGHELLELQDGVEIKHTVCLETEMVNEKSLMVLQNIFADVPQAVLKLKELVEKC